MARTLPESQPAPYWLYLLECEGGVYYAGIALDVEQRFFQHVFGRGARFTRARAPVRVLAAREYLSKGDALRAELQLKALPRAEKLAFFASGTSPRTGSRTAATSAARVRNNKGTHPAAARQPTHARPRA
jgi:putative endonuclease